MNPDNTQHMDVTDVLIIVAGFACFVVFGICLWLIRRERDKRKNAASRNLAPPKIP